MYLLANRYNIHRHTAIFTTIFVLLMLVPPLVFQTVTYVKMRDALVARDAFQTAEIERLANAQIRLLDLLETEHDITTPKSKEALDAMRAALIQQKQRLHD
jgi:hypothetical protein